MKHVIYDVLTALVLGTITGVLMTVVFYILIIFGIKTGFLW